MSDQQAPEPHSNVSQPQQPGPCKFCGTPTSDQVAGDFICLTCYSEAGACCSESDC